MDRYSSQRLYKNIGKKGQEVLGRSKAAIVGIGALGTVCADLLARAGVGSLYLIDRDFVELSNLQRQTLYDESDIGKPKADVAATKLKKINSEIKIRAKSEDVDFSNINILGKPDVIIAATDNMESRFLLNDYCLKKKIPLVYGGAIEDNGSLFSVIPGGICLRCIFPGSTQDTCDNTGILNTCSSIIGSMMASESIKILLGEEGVKDLIYFNTMSYDLSKINVKKNKNCPACKGNYEYLKGEIRTKIIFLCGNGTYHIKGKKKGLFELSKKLSKLGKVSKFAGIIHFKEITLFEDGRAIIKAKTEKDAKQLYSRYIGN